MITQGKAMSRSFSSWALIIRTSVDHLSMEGDTQTLGTPIGRVQLENPGPWVSALRH